MFQLLLLTSAGYHTEQKAAAVGTTDINAFADWRYAEKAHTGICAAFDSVTNVLQERVDYIEKELTESLTNEASTASHEEIRKRGSARSALVRTCRESSGHKRLGQRVELRIVALDGQPKRFGRCSVAMPPFSCSFGQRNIDWRETQTRRAPSAGHTPAATKRMPCLGRVSSASGLGSMSILTSNETIAGE